MSRRRWCAALALVASAGCTRHTPPPTWPADLTSGWSAVELKVGDRSVRATLSGGTWRLTAPRQGDADPDTIDRLALALKAPQVLASRAVPGGAHRYDREIFLDTKGGRHWHLGLRSAALGAPVVVTLDGVGEFTVSPVELANKVPEPDELLTPGLWVAAERHAQSLTVFGPVSYALTGKGEDWVVVDGGTPARDLDIPPGTITGRQAIGHPAASPAALGLAPPLAVAHLCTESACRDFAFGKAETDAGTRYYAQAPDADPVELRASDWKAVVEGPFTR